MERAGLAGLLLLTGCWVTSKEMNDKFLEVYGPGTGLGTGLATGGGTGTGTGTPGGLPTGVTTSTLLPCADVDIGSAVGQAFSGTTDGLGNDLSDACGMASTGNDVVHQWTAPNSACFTFDTIGSGYDTLLALYESSCAGPPVICNDNRHDDTTLSQVGFEVTSGTTYLVVVDGPDGGDNGFYELNISPSERLVADVDLGSNTGTYSDTNVGADDTLNPTSCPYNSSADVLLSWTAPSAATWTFETDPIQTTFDSVLSVHRQCIDDALVCDDFNGLGNERVQLTLEANEQVFIRVGGFDGGTGTFQLRIY